MTYEELLQAMLDRVPSDVDKREGSVIYDALAPCAYFLAQQDFQIQPLVSIWTGRQRPTMFPESQPQKQCV